MSDELEFGVATEVQTVPARLLEDEMRGVVH